MPPNTLSIEAVLQHYQSEIDKNKDDISKTKDGYHQLDKSIIALHAEFKKSQELTRQEMLNLSDKIDGLGDNYKNLEEYIKEQNNVLNGRVNVLEISHNTRQWWLNAALKILKRAGQLWWLWLLLITSCFAFDVEFKVKNPDLVSLLVQVVKSKL